MNIWITAASLLALAVIAPAAQQPPVQFEARADLILVDATVVDGNGTPVGDLAPEDFVVSIDGQPRAIASLQFVKTSGPANAPARPRASHYSSNEGESDARRIMILVDENSIPPGAARSVLASVDRLVNGLSPADRLGFIRLPRFEGSVDFTLDRQRVLDAVKRTIGKADRVGLGRVTISEAVALDGNDSLGWDRALTRICGRTAPGTTSTPGGGGGGVTAAPDSDLAICRQTSETDAVEKIATYRQRARETVSGIGQILSNLRATPGPKTLILLSQGFLSHDIRLEISRLGDMAAAARVAVYAVHIDMSGRDVDATEPSFTRSDDERLLADGPQDLAGAARGARFRIVGSGENIFARVARELSGYYLIGVEPTDADRDGKPHRIKVDVKRPATTVRARAQFTIDAVAVEPASSAPGGRLVEVLRSATPAAGIPLRVAAFAAPATVADRIKVIVSADIGTPTASQAGLEIGFLVLDANGKVIANQFVSTAKMDRGDDASSLLYVANAEVPPGEYTVRFAAVDPEGRIGSVHHPVIARLRAAGNVGVSDLILAGSGRGGEVRPEVHVNLQGETLRAMLELSASDARLLNDTQVTFAVAEKEGGAAIVSERAVPQRSDERVRAAGVALHVGVLPPGEYIARATIAVPGHEAVIATRPFQIAARARAAKPVETARSPAPSVSRGRMRPPIPPFKPQDVLAPAVVEPFIDHVLTRYSPSAAAREALTAIKAGDLHSKKLDAQVGDVGLSFARGLCLLAENRAAEASAYFRAALRSESDFIGAAFYLGATLAASGKDRDAVGAWQTALIGEVGTAGVYPVLVDGLLRLGEAEHALDLLNEAEPTFIDRAQYERRRVQAYALLGRVADALPLAHAHLAKQPGDIDILYLTMHMIYEAFASGERSDTSELDRFRDYAAAYIAANGPQIQVVQGWRKALGIR